MWKDRVFEIIDFFDFISFTGWIFIDDWFISVNFIKPMNYVVFVFYLRILENKEKLNDYLNDFISSLGHDIQ